MTDAQDRGWGPGWPTPVPASELTQVDIDGTRFPGGVRDEVAELVTLLVTECKAHGYVFGVYGDPAYGCWGYSSRAISGTQTASNHSWGLAVDINAPSNPQSPTFTTDMPGWLPELWKTYGFEWGGDYTPPTKYDPMHFEFMGTPGDAAAFTDLARSDLGGEVEDMKALIVEDGTGGTWVVAVDLSTKTPLGDPRWTRPRLEATGCYVAAELDGHTFAAIPDVRG